VPFFCYVYPHVHLLNNESTLKHIFISDGRFFYFDEEEPNDGRIIQRGDLDRECWCLIYTYHALEAHVLKEYCLHPNTVTEFAASAFGSCLKCCG